MILAHALSRKDAALDNQANYDEALATCHAEIDLPVLQCLFVWTTTKDFLDSMYKVFPEPLHNLFLH
jgi:hypothetical protein